MATLFEHPSGDPTLPPDTTLVAEFGGDAEAISLDRAWVASNIEDSGIRSIRWSGVGPDAFVFIAETCQGQDRVGFRALAFDRSVPTATLWSASKSDQSAKDAEGPCTLYVFGIDGIGGDRRGRLEIERLSRDTLYVDLEGHTVEGRPAIDTDSTSMTSGGQTNYALSSSLEARDGVFPVELFHLNGGFDYWRSSQGGYMGRVDLDDSLSAVRYLVFLFDQSNFE